jgi:hypothetical protein
MGATLEPNYEPQTGSVYLPKGTPMMTTGRSKGLWHEVLTPHGLAWISKTDLVWRGNGKDTRRTRKVSL